MYSYSESASFMEVKEAAKRYFDTKVWQQYLKVENERITLGNMAISFDPMERAIQRELHREFPGGNYEQTDTDN